MTTEKPNLLLTKTHQFCKKLVSTLFSVLEDDIKRDPEIEFKCLGLVANYFNMSSGSFQFKEQQYFDYVKTTCREMGYKEEDIEKTTIFRYATELRKLFRADPAFLKSADFELDVTALPDSKAVKATLGGKFNILATTFRKTFDEKLVTKDVEKFIQGKIDEVLGNS